MTQDEIMKMAHEAGLHIATDDNWMPIISLEYVVKLANLVAQHEREECLKLADSLGWVNVDHIKARGQA
jgi:hypothetical protein